MAYNILIFNIYEENGWRTNKIDQFQKNRLSFKYLKGWAYQLTKVSLGWCKVKRCKHIMDWWLRITKLQILYTVRQSTPSGKHALHKLRAIKVKAKFPRQKSKNKKAELFTILKHTMRPWPSGQEVKSEIKHTRKIITATAQTHHAHFLFFLIWLA